MPVLVMALSGNGDLLRQLKSADVLIRVGEDYSVAWSEISILALLE